MIGGMDVGSFDILVIFCGRDAECRERGLADITGWGSGMEIPRFVI